MVTRIYEKSGKMIENNREKIHIEALKNLQPGSSIHGRRHFEIRYLYDLFTIFYDNYSNRTLHAIVRVN